MLHSKNHIFRVLFQMLPIRVVALDFFICHKEATFEFPDMICIWLDMRACQTLHVKTNFSHPVLEVPCVWHALHFQRSPRSCLHMRCHPFMQLLRVLKNICCLDERREAAKAYDRLVNIRNKLTEKFACELNRTKRQRNENFFHSRGVLSTLTHKCPGKQCESPSSCR